MPGFSLRLHTAGTVFVALLLSAQALAAPASARVVAKVDISSQRMFVSVDGQHYATWKVSTARRGYHTPRGVFRPKRMKRMHYSHKYDMSPMPYSIFLKGGYAIHGTDSIRRLGRPASHGCIRLHPRNARKLYYLVNQHGMKNTRIHTSY
jgi:lipoprotein-anchoring transpeptidase ErfK/SrfK